MTGTWHCGHPRTPENTKPGKKGTRCLVCINATAERNRRMAADYIGGMTAAQVAEKYGVVQMTVSNIMRKRGIKLSERERGKRGQEGLKRSGAKPGRKTVWPDCPPRLRREYDRLRNRYGIPSAKARAMLEADMKRMGGNGTSSLMRDVGKSVSELPTSFGEAA